MEERRGILSHLSSLVRIILAVIVIVVLAFLVIRFINGRRDNPASQGEVATESVPGNSPRERADSQETTAPGEDRSRDEADIPRGIADQTPTTGPARVPATGLAENLFTTTLLLTAAVYLYCLNRQLVRQRSAASLVSFDI